SSVLTTGGIKLQTMTQARLYAYLRDDTLAEHRKTGYNLEEARVAILEWTGQDTSKGEIWKSLRNKTIPYNIRGFLWKAMHSAYMTGDYWRDVPGHEQRIDCHECGEESSLRHILTQCRASGQGVIWAEVEKVWQLKKLPWHGVSLGMILGCSMLNLRTASGCALKGPSRLLKILVSESSHLAWKIYWEWTIELNADPQRRLSEDEVRKHWIRVMNSRLLLDMIQIGNFMGHPWTNKTKFGHRAIPPQLVESTWWDVLQDKQSLGDDWINQRRGVLVGTERRPPGRNR
ncbi:hypothetical protein CPC08DRAFT_645605, partial [Agrocybe pediades]